MKSCRHCGAQVRWAVTNNGKKTLLDYEPDETDGDVVLLALPAEQSIEVAVALKDNDRGEDLLQKARQAGVPLRTVHFNTCTAQPEKRP